VLQNISRFDILKHLMPPCDILLTCSPKGVQGI
jgi:hypothetical protein